MTTLVLADTQPLFRSALHSALEGSDEFTVVALPADAASTVRAVEQHRPDAVLLDSAMPDHPAVLRALRAQHSATRVLVLAPAPDSYLLLQALDAGAHGFLPKDQPLSALLEATRAVMRGETSVPPGMLGGLLHDLIERRRAEREQFEKLGRLTRREREVLELLAAGHDHESLAAHLVISPPTARSHIQNLLRKLDVHSRLEAVALLTGDVPLPSSLEPTP